MELYIAICDDLYEDAELLNKYIEEYGVKHNLTLKIFRYLSGITLLEDLKKGKDYSIIFLDIYMDESNGIETARAIRNFGNPCMIIFTTTSLDHAIDSYEVQAAHYLIKPLDYEKVEDALDRCKQCFQEVEHYIEIKSDRIMVRVLLHELMFAEIYSNLTILHSLSGEVRTYMSLDELFLLLKDKGFLRCHRSYIINMKYITDVDNCDFILKNKQKIPIRRQEKQQIKQQYADYLFDIVRRRENV